MPLALAALGYAHASLCAGRSFALHEIRVTGVLASDGFAFAMFVTSWVRWMRTPMTPTNAN